MSKQEGRRKAWAELAGVSENQPHNDVFMQFAAGLGYAGTFNDRMIRYLQDALPSAAKNLPDLKREAAQFLGLDSWNSVGYEIIALGGTPIIPPTVNAGGPYLGPVSTPIALDGTVVQGDYPIASTLWTIVSGGTGTFGNAALVDTTFTPNSGGAYVLRLTATPTVGIPVNDTADLTSTGGETFYILAQNNDRLLTQNGLNLMVTQGAP